MYFPLDDLPGQEEFDSLQLDVQHAEAIRAFGVSVDDLTTRLAERGIPFRKGSEISSPGDEESLLCEIESTIDKTIRRGTAKIAFNYLAYWERNGFVRQPQFDLIREFIRHGCDEPYPLVRVSSDSVLADERYSNALRVGHTLTLNWASDGVSIVAQLSLLGFFKYSVCLARDYDGERRDISRGHFFNIGGREIIKIGRRGQSLET